MKKPAKKVVSRLKPAKKAPAPKKAASKAKATPKPKAAQTRNEPKDEPKTQAGSNMASLSKDQKRAIFLNHVTMWDAVEKAVAKAVKRRKECSDLIKAEGGDIALTKQGVRLRASDDRPAERVRSEEIKIRRNIEATLAVAAYVGSDLGQGQIDWLEGLQPAADRAFDEGKMAGLQAGPRKPPYDPSVPQYKRWFEGFDEGQAVLKSKFAKTAGEKKDSQPQLIFDELEPPAKEAAPVAAKKASSKGQNKGQGDDKKPADGTDGAGEPKTQPTPPAGKPQPSQTPASTQETGPELDAKQPTPPAPPPDEPAQTDLQIGGEAPVGDGATKH